MQVTQRFSRLRRARRPVSLLLLGLALGAFMSPMSASARKAEGTGSRSARADAVRSVPLSKFTPQDRAKAVRVLKDVTVFRRLPEQVIECDPSLYLFLIDHPHLLVNIWEVLDISNIALQADDGGVFQANDGAGTVGRVEYLHRSHDTHVLYAQGAYDGPLFLKPVKGECLLVLKSAYVREPNGKYYVTCRLDAFIRVEHSGVELVARTFHPLVGKTADHNFRETTSFLAVLNRTAEVNPGGMQELAGKLNNVTDDERQRFLELSEQISVRAAMQASAEQDAYSGASSLRRMMGVKTLARRATAD